MGSAPFVVGSEVTDWCIWVRCSGHGEQHLSPPENQSAGPKAGVPTLEQCWLLAVAQAILLTSPRKSAHFTGANGFCLKTSCPSSGRMLRWLLVSRSADQENLFLLSMTERLAQKTKEQSMTKTLCCWHHRCIQCIIFNVLKLLPNNTVTSHDNVHRSRCSRRICCGLDCQAN